MNNTLWYSKITKTLIVLPNMGTGVKVADNSIEVCPFMILNNIIQRDDSYKKIRGFDIA